MKVATFKKGIAGFRSAGVCPLDPDKFLDKDFLLAQELLLVAIENKLEDENITDTEMQVNSEIDPMPGINIKIKCFFFGFITITKGAHDLKKIRKYTRKRSEILTSIPIKEVLEEKIKKKAAASDKKTKKVKGKGTVSQKGKKLPHVKKIKF